MGWRWQFLVYTAQCKQNVVRSNAVILGLQLMDGWTMTSSICVHFVHFLQRRDNFTFTHNIYRSECCSVLHLVLIPDLVPFKPIKHVQVWRNNRDANQNIAKTSWPWVYSVFESRVNRYTPKLVALLWSWECGWRTVMQVGQQSVGFTRLKRRQRSFRLCSGLSLLGAISLSLNR
jgi:hypothetical protein